MRCYQAPSSERPQISNVKFNDQPVSKLARLSRGLVAFVSPICPDRKVTSACCCRYSGRGKRTGSGPSALQVGTSVSFENPEEGSGIRVRQHGKETAS
jgi:hypothetical protein